MPSPTYVAIAKTVLTGTQASVLFSAIPQTYTDLLLLISARSNVTAVEQYFGIVVNSIATSYTERILRGDGSAASSINDTSFGSPGNWAAGFVAGANATASTFGNAEFYFANYTGSTNKVLSGTGIGENNAAAGAQMASGNLLSNTAAISSLTIYPSWSTGSGNLFQSGSRFDLYGIKNA